MIKGLDYRLNNPELEGARTETDKASTEKKAKKRPQDANIKNPNEAQGVIWSYHIILYFLVYVLMNSLMLPFFSKIFQPSKLSLACFILDTLMDCNSEKIFMTIMRSFNLYITEINHTLSSYNNSQWAHHVAYWAAEWSVHGREALIMEADRGIWYLVEAIPPLKESLSVEGTNLFSLGNIFSHFPSISRCHSEYCANAAEHFDIKTFVLVPSESVFSFSDFFGGS